MPRLKAKFSRRPHERRPLLAPNQYEVPDSLLIDLQQLFAEAASARKSRRLRRAAVETRVEKRSTEKLQSQADRNGQERGLGEPARVSPAPTDRAVDLARSFAQAVATEGLWARSMLSQAMDDLTLPEVRAEMHDLNRLAREAVGKLRRVSRDVEYRLTIEPLKIADDLESLAADTARALAAVDAEAEPPGVIATRGAILEELVLRTLRLCKAFGIPVSSTASDKSVQASTAIRVLVAAGTVAGAVLAETTWRAYVSSALRREPTLK